MKLGFRAEGPERIPHSTAELPPGTNLIIIEGKNRLSGRIVKLEERYFLVSSEQKHGLPSQGSRVGVLIQKESGLYGFKSVAGKNERGMFRLMHTEDIQRVQRRKYYRRHTALPVMVRKAGCGQQWMRSALKDLGGGGASLRAPSASLGSGDEVEIAFPLQKGPPVRVAGVVVRLSGNVLHVQFGPIEEALRDRIMAYLFRPKRR